MISLSEKLLAAIPGRHCAFRVFSFLRSNVRLDSRSNHILPRESALRILKGVVYNNRITAGAGVFHFFLHDIYSLDEHAQKLRRYSAVFLLSDTFHIESNSSPDQC